MQQKLKVDINIEGTPITYFSKFSLIQRFNHHHTFQLRFNHDMVEQYTSISLEKSKDFIGKNITVQFSKSEEGENLFSGIITKVEFLQSDGFNGDIMLSGFSPDILLERGSNLGSYLDKNLKTIIQQVAQDAPQNDLSFRINPVRTEPIDYIIQYKESDFEFINRISAEYYEWFYYDGTKLNFGKPDKLDEVSLIYGRDIQGLQYEMQLAPLKSTKFAYAAQSNNLLVAEAGRNSDNNTPDVSHAVDSSNAIFSKKYNDLLAVRALTAKEIADIAALEQNARVTDLVKIKGEGDNPAVGLAKVLNISISKRGLTDFEVHSFGKFLVTAVSHNIDGVGHYSNTFEGVTSDVENLLVKNADKPQPDMQLAEVISNDDPAKQGRVKVRFKWQTESNDDTEWLRVVTPSAGSDGSGQNNRGFIAIPEVGDQVLIGFEEGNIARPVIMGSVYHSGNGDSQQQVNNNIKSIITRSGCTIKFNDTDGQGSITINDPSGNTWFMDGKGSITVTAPRNFTVNAGENISLNAGLSATVNAGANIIETAGMNIGHSAGAMIRQTATEDYTLMAANIIKMAKENITTDAKTGSKQAKQDITVTSQQGSINHHAQKEIQNNSSENAKLH